MWRPDLVRPRPAGLSRGARALAVVGATVLAASCGGDGDDAAARGERIATDVGCTACHDTGTTTRIGPGWGDTWGDEVELDDGRTVVVDEEYLRRSILEPTADVRAGFPPSMPRIPLSDEELDDVTAYLRELAGG